MLSRVRRSWRNAGLLVKGLRIVALPVVALVVTAALVLDANASRVDAHDRREAAEAVDAAARKVHATLDTAKDLVARAATTGDQTINQGLLALRGDLERSLADVEAGALREPDMTLRAQVGELRAATEALVDSSTELLTLPVGTTPDPALVTRTTDANTRFEAAIGAISARASQNARDYADAYDAEAATSSRLIVVAALLASLGAIAAMVVFSVSTRRRVRLLETNARALGEGAPMTAMPDQDDELGRLGQDLMRASDVLRRREEELHEAFATLRQSESRLAFALESGAMGTWDVDLLTNTHTWDAQAEADHGLVPGTFGSTFETWMDLVHPDDRAKVMSDGGSAIVNGGRWSTEYRTLAGDGTRWIGVQGQALLDESGKPVRLVGVTTDITERVLAEQRLRDAMAEAERANRTKNEFLSRVSHELRTPLNAILGFGQLLEMDELSDTQRESVTHVLSGGRHLLGLIEDVLDISRIESGDLPISLEAVALREVVDETVSMVAGLAADRDVTVRVDAGEWGRAHVRADRRRLKQVLVNLASNAVKYNRHGGQVLFRLSSPATGMMRVEVTDTGHGIPAESLDRIFTPFDRLGAENTAIEGTGIGLALSQRLAEMMAATLTVESTDGEGSTFSVDLPMAADPADLVEAVADAAWGGDSPAGTVLYVEDNPSNLRLVQRVLDRRGGVRLLTAATGALALALASRVAVDVVLLDLHLPDMPGEDVLRRLRAEPLTATTPIVVVSADATPGRIERLRAAGADAFLTKPLDLATFGSTLDRFLSKAVAR